jgi:hypothetical protein
MSVDADVAVDACPCVEELWELEARVPEHHHRPSKGPEAEAEHGRAEQDQLELDQPPPPPPNLVDMMAIQTQQMQRIAEAMEHRGNGGNRVAPQSEDLTRKIERFIRLKAPTFSYSNDPLEADDLLRVIETKLDLTICSDEECVAIGAHQLEGPAKAWWDNYTATHPNLAFITWLEFCVAFREQYMPGKMLVQKAHEFCTMTQGAMRVEEYEHHFVKMMRYAPDDTNTDQKKQFWFL